MKTMKNIIDDTRRMTYGSLSDQINLLASDYPVNGTELEFELSVTGITPGMILSSGLNVWWVKEVSASSNTVYVVPRYEGSFAERLPAGEVVFIKPRVSDWFLFNAVNDVISQLSSPTYGLYRLGQFEVTPNGAYDTLTIPDDLSIDGIVSVAVLERRGSNRWFEMPPRTYRWMPEHQSIKLLRHMWTGTPIRVEYKAPFKKAESLIWDVESQSGLTPTMTDLPALGATTTLLRTTESRRNQINVQGDPRRADEVQAGANSSAAREMDRQFKSRINDEYIRLTTRNPIYMGV